MRLHYHASSNHNKTLQAASALRRRCDGHEDMTLAKLVEICKESGMPLSPLAVTRLELNCQLFTRIGECIAEYRDVQQLHLDRNRIRRIENLGALSHLRCLYLQGNAISCIEGLDGLQQLQLLDLSGNAIQTLTGLAGLPRLEALLVAHNQLSDARSIDHLRHCTALCELDLGHNQLADGEAVLQVLSAMPALRTLTLERNSLAGAPAAPRPPLAVCTADICSDDAPAVQAAAAGTDAVRVHESGIALGGRKEASALPEGRSAADAGAAAAEVSGEAAAGGPAPAQPPDREEPQSRLHPLAFYRRTVVARCRGLTALDHRVVFPQERRYAEAWWAETQQVEQQSLSLRCSDGTAAAEDARWGTEVPSGAVGRETAAAEAAAASEAVSMAVAPETAMAAEATAAAPPPDGALLPLDVLYPVLSRLDSRSLVVAALACRHWASVAAFPLGAQRRLAAQAAFTSAAAAVPRLAAALTDVRRDELDELLAAELPARPLAQLFFALEVLGAVWEHLRRRTAGLARGEPPSRHGGSPAPAAAACGAAAAASAVEANGGVTGAGPDATASRGAGISDTIRNAVALPGGTEAGRSDGEGERFREREGGGSQDAGSALDVPLLHGRGASMDEPAQLRSAGDSGSCSAHGGSLGTLNGSSALASDGGTDAGTAYGSAAAHGDGERGGSADSRPYGLTDDLDPTQLGWLLDECLDLDVDPEPVDLDSPTWRMASWEAAKRLLRRRDFPLPSLLGSLPLGPRALALLRSRTGSADDLDWYVPQLRAVDVARHNASAGRLAEWLLGVEAHCRAAHELDAACAWEWPRVVTRRTAAGCGDGGASTGNASGGSAAGLCAACAGDATDHCRAVDGSSAGLGGGNGGRTGDGRTWPSASAAAAEMEAAIAEVLEARRVAALARAEAEAQARAAAQAAEAAAAAAAQAAEAAAEAAVEAAAAAAVAADSAAHGPGGEAEGLVGLVAGTNAGGVV